MPMNYGEDMALRKTKLHEAKKACEVCTSCYALVVSRKLAPYKKATFGYGRANSSVMFVGEAPGLKGCATTGIPFTKDQSGEFYQWVLKYLGVNKEQVYTTNIVKCWPMDEVSGSNRTPTQREVENCFGHLLNEIRIVQPKHIVALGRVPEKILREKIRDIPIDYIPHPAWMLRQGIRPGSEAAKAYAMKFKKFIPKASVGKQEKLDDHF